MKNTKERLALGQGPGNEIIIMRTKNKLIYTISPFFFSFCF